MHRDPWPYYPFAVPFFELNTTNVVESAGSAVVIVELRSTELAFDIEVTVETVFGTAAGIMACDV